MKSKNWVLSFALVGSWLALLGLMPGWVSSAVAADVGVWMNPDGSRLKDSEKWIQRWVALSARNHLPEAGFSRVNWRPESGNPKVVFVVGSHSGGDGISLDQWKRAAHHVDHWVIPESFRRLTGPGGSLAALLRGKTVTWIPDEISFQGVFFPRLFSELARKRQGFSGLIVEEAEHWACSVLSLKSRYCNEKISGLAVLRWARPEGARARLRYSAKLPRWWSGAITSWVAPPLSREGENSSPTSTELNSSREMERGLAFPSWEYLTDIFPGDLTDLPGEIGGVPEQIWMDGEGLRYLLGSWVDGLHPGLVSRVTEELLGLRLRQKPDRLEAGLYLHGPIEAVVKSQDDAATGELWGCRIPESLRFSFRIIDGGDLELNAMSRDAQRSLELKIRLPCFPDGVYLRRVKVSLVTGDAEIEAGIIGNYVGVVAKVNLFAQRLQEIDFWGTVESNLKVFPGIQWIFDRWGDGRSTL